MIRVRAPLRFTLGGGGTDLPSYYSKFGGMVFAAAINQYAYVDLGSDGFSTRSDVPPGSGLGLSSAVWVAKELALHEGVCAQPLAEAACDKEMREEGRGVGKQDAYVAAFGGFPVLEIATDGTVHVRQAKITDEVRERLRRNTLLFFTGRTRDAAKVLKDQDRKVPDALHLIKDLGYRILEALEGGDPDRFGRLMDEHWRVKQTMSTKISDGWIRDVYAAAKESGATGGKITGAGGGGFFVLYCPEEHNRLRRAMVSLGLRELNYEFSAQGAERYTILSKSCSATFSSASPQAQEALA